MRPAGGIDAQNSPVARYHSQRSQVAPESWTSGTAQDTRVPAVSCVYKSPSFVDRGIAHRGLRGQGCSCDCLDAAFMNSCAVRRRWRSLFASAFAGPTHPAAQAAHPADQPAHPASWQVHPAVIRDSRQITRCCAPRFESIRISSTMIFICFCCACRSFRNSDPRKDRPLRSAHGAQTLSDLSPEKTDTRGESPGPTGCK